MSDLSTNRKFCLFCLSVFILTLLCWQPGQAQQIKAEIVLHTDKLPIEEREYLTSLDDQLTQVIDSYSWIDRGYEYELPLRIEIFFETYSRAATYRRYGAGVMVATRSGIQLRDSRWDFRYSRDFALRIGDPNESFLSLIEYYTWICLGFELDRYSPLGGQPFYEKASFVSENARFDIDYIRGWDKRRDFVRDFTRDKYSDLRTAAFHTEAGLYYTRNGKAETAMTHLSRAVELITTRKPEEMELHRDNHIIRFINIQDLVKALEQAGSFDLIETLEKWDEEHPERYHD